VEVSTVLFIYKPIQGKEYKLEGEVVLEKEKEV